MTASSTRLPRLYTVDEVAAYLRMSSKSVRRFIARGDLQCRRVGNSIRVSEGNLETFLSAIKCVSSNEQRCLSLSK